MGQRTIIDNKNKLEEVGRAVSFTFDRLHQVYNKVKDTSAVNSTDLKAVRRAIMAHFLS